MKLTKAQLKYLIREELEAVLEEEELEEEAVVGQSRPATPEELQKRLGGTGYQTLDPSQAGPPGMTPLRPKTKDAAVHGVKIAKPIEDPPSTLPGQKRLKGAKVYGAGGKAQYPDDIMTTQAQTGGVVGPQTPHGTEVLNIPGTRNERLKRNLEQIVREAVERLFP